MIAEPVTTVTDLILAGECFLFGHLLFWGKGTDKSFIKYWALAFLALGFSALMGGIAHGAAPYMENIPSLLLTWPATIFSIVTTSFFLYLALIHEFCSSHKKLWVTLVGIVTLFFYLNVFGFLNVFHVNGQLSFMVAILSYAPAMFLHLVFNTLRYFHTHQLSTAYVCNGIILSFFGTLVQILKFAPHEHFNHNDLYHVIQMVALYMIFKGLRLKLSVSKGVA